METIKIKGGFTLPHSRFGVAAAGQRSASPEIVNYITPAQIGVLGTDFPLLRPALTVKPGDKVNAGDTLFTDKGLNQLPILAPISGTVADIHRGDKRRLLSVVIDAEASAPPNWKAKDPVKITKSGKVNADNLCQALINNGLWARLRQRPYDRIPSPDSRPSKIFVTAMDTRPFATDITNAVLRDLQGFEAGLTALASLPQNGIEVGFAAADARMGEALQGMTKVPGLNATAYTGGHPAGLAGTHIFYRADLEGDGACWYIDARDVVVIGRLVREGEVDYSRQVAVADLTTQKHTLVNTIVGAEIKQLLNTPGSVSPSSPSNSPPISRDVSGSPLYGHRAEGALGYLSLYDFQACKLPLPREPEFLNWLRPGSDRHSVLSVFLAQFLRLMGVRTNERYDTSLNGSERGIIPIRAYEQAMVLDLPIVHLLRSLAVGDTEKSQQLGVLGLGPEDLSLVTYACPSKYDYCSILRDLLSTIEREG